jgi:hypothetical protein
MNTLNWNDFFCRTISYSRLGNGIRLGSLRVEQEDILDFGETIGKVSARELRAAMSGFECVTEGKFQPQLAFYMFMVTRRSRLLDSYFPLLRALNEQEQGVFYDLVQRIMLNPGFSIQLRDETQSDIIAQVPTIAYLIGGHLAELFYFRTDMVEQLLRATCRVRLYISQKAFAADGGMAGGCYNPRMSSVQLVLSRLFEGFSDKTPGVFPFLHEFGHLLDFFDAGTALSTMTSSGFLPGMRPTDGELYSAAARNWFIEGKRVELERYSLLCKGQRNLAPLPIGHPYVFQNDTEFIAGYLEMFFRNPNYFAEQNEILFKGFSTVFKQDPRAYWKQDFPFYVEQNRGFYLSGQRPPQPGITIPPL